MAAATYNTDLTTLTTDPDSGEATSNWAALGGGASGLNVETDYFLQGVNCVSKNAWAGDEKGMIEDTTNNTLSAGSGNAVYTWVTHLTPGSLATKANGGICIVLGSSSTVYNEYDYAGSDTIDYGAPWICAVIDPDNATATTGTVTTANMDCYGATANLPVGGPTKGAPFGIDVIRYGRSIEINDGVGAPANFTDMAVQNDSTSNRWGQFQRTPGSNTNFTMQCRVEFGDTTNTTACEFSDSNKNIAINDLEFVASTFIEFDITQGSDVTLTSCNFTATSGANTRGRWVSTSTGTVLLDSCSFTNMDTFGFSSGTTVDACTFRQCGLVTQASATITGCIFDGGTATAALLSSDTTIADVTDNTFISDGTGHAVDLGTIDTSGGDQSVTWDNTLDDGAGSEWTGTTGSVSSGGSTNSAILLAVTGGNKVTISCTSTASIPTVRWTGTGTVEVTANEVSFTVTVQDGSVTPAATITDESVNVYVEAAAGGPLAAGTQIIKGLTNTSGQISSTPASYASDQPVTGWARRSSPGLGALPSGTTFFKQAPISGTITTSAGGSATVALQSDE